MLNLFKINLIIEELNGVVPKKKKNKYFYWF